MPGKSQYIFWWWLDILCKCIIPLQFPANTSSESWSGIHIWTKLPENNMHQTSLMQHPPFSLDSMLAKQGTLCPLVLHASIADEVQRWFCINVFLNKYPTSKSDSAPQLLSAVVYNEKSWTFHICCCQAKWSSKWLNGKNRTRRGIIIE